MHIDQSDKIMVLDYVGLPNSPGNARNNGGRTVELSYGQEKTILHVQGTSNTSEVLTVTLSCLPKNPSNDDGPARYSLNTPKCKAIVEWGSDGASLSCEIDVKHGTTFSLPAASCRVTVKNEIEPTDPNVEFYSQYAVISAAIGYRPRAGGDVPTRTLSSQVGEDALFVVIPPFAKGVKLFSEDSLDQPYFFGIFTAADGTITPLAYGGMVNNGAGVSPCSIPNGAQVVFIEASEEPFLAVFDIAL